MVADTKFEFGLLPVEDGDGRPVEDRIILIDEVAHTRFLALLAQGTRTVREERRRASTNSFVRDYLERIHWNKQPPVPSLP